MFYILPVGIVGPYFNWQYAQEHGFMSWLLLGEVHATLRAVVWPLVIFPFTAIRDFTVSIATGTILILSLCRLICRVQFSLSNAISLSLFGQTLLCIIGMIVGLLATLFSHQTDDGAATNITIIMVLVSVPLGCFLQALLIQFAAHTQDDIISRWRAIILSILVIIGEFFVATFLIELWEQFRK